MFRNREFKWLLIIICTVDVLAFTLMTTISPNNIWFVSAIVVVFNLIILLFTIWRYRELKKLSHYLRQISSGDYKMDVRDNNEGELSILKNEIYKVTTILAEHGTLLQADKVHLTNAISDISHQLKTPLTSMMVMADLLNDTNLPTDKRAEFTQNIQIQLERLNWLVSSLLKLSKIDAGTIHFKKDTINVQALIEHALKSIMIPIDIKEQTLSIKGDTSITCQGDFEWLTEALINILKNCVEHTAEKGSIEITFSQNVLFTEILIKDNGGGISKQDLPFVFQRFYKGQAASEESVGIGLAMAHTIITNQGGDLQVDSTQGVGSQFHVTFYHTHQNK